MINNKAIHDLINSIKIECNAWLDFVDNIYGNQNAATDSQLERILKLSDTLKKEYDKI